jgi:diguanylate cyclase (GGDEF)-like protein
MSKDEMADAAAALDQALYVHEKWTRRVIGTLLCRLQPDDRDISESPHHQCAFGLWYDAQSGTPLSRHPGFIAIEAIHEEMHRIVTHMLNESSEGRAITVSDYEGFNDASTGMRAGIAGLRREVEDGLNGFDSLTGATRRVNMLTRLRDQHELVKRGVLSCSIAMMDLDHFKVVNDTFGHQTGDAVLVKIVGLVKDHLRPYDDLFRYGGEEFLLCVPGDTLEQGFETIERLRIAVKADSIELGDGRKIEMTTSFGLTSIDPLVPVEESIARADRALYKAKEAGRNQTRVWDASLD